MPEFKIPSLAGGEILSKLTSLFDPADKRLDQAKKSFEANLEQIKEKGQLQNLAATAYLSFEKGFKIDLNENGKTGEAQKPYLAIIKETWKTQEMDRMFKEVNESTERKAIDNFIGHLENLDVMKKLIQEAEPQAKWQTMLAGIFGNVPGLGENFNQYFGPVLSMLGLDSLIKPAPKAEAKKDTEKKDEKKDKKEGQKDDPTDSPTEKKEAIRKTPESTIFFGDSNTVAMVSKSKDILKINGKVNSHSAVGMSARWGRDEIEEMSKKKPNPLKQYKNAVILFGTNDLLAYKPEEIIGFLKKIYAKLEEAGVNIYAVTIPPVGGYAKYDRVLAKGGKDLPRAEVTRNAVNEWILGKSVKECNVHHIINLAATEKDGGIADDEHPNKLCKNAHSGDWVHFDKRLLATIYQRELEIGTGKTA